MSDRTRKRPNKANALARWDNEGGAAKGAPQQDRDELTSLTEDEEHILRRLGAAVIMQWNDLPRAIHTNSLTTLFRWARCSTRLS